MDVPLSKQFVLWRGDKRFVVGEEDVQAAKISSVFKVCTFYCKWEARWPHGQCARLRSEQSEFEP